MSVLIDGRECAHEAWASAVRFLAEGDVANLIVEFPVGCDRHGVFEQAFEEWVKSRSLSPLSSVINTVFPRTLSMTSDSRQELYARYSRIYPKILMCRPSRRGTYFGRMIGYDRDRHLGSGTNQLERAITELSNPKGLRHGAEITLVVPEKDAHPMGFPCLSHLSFHKGDDGVRLTALYRNHYFIERALGNYLALDSLLGFVSNASGFRGTNATVISTAARIDGSKELAAAAIDLWVTTRE